MKKLLPLLLCILLLLSACGKEPDETPDSPDEPSVPSTPDVEKPKEPDPQEVILAAYDAAVTDLQNRFESSRLHYVAGLAAASSLTADYSAGIPDDQGEIAATAEGTIVYERMTGEANISLALKDLDFEGMIYYSPEFLGFASDILSGDGVYYGLKPVDMAGQLEGTPIADLFELDIDSVRELDALLEKVPSDIGVYREGSVDAAIRITRELIEAMDLTLSASSGGYEIKGQLAPETLAGYIESLAGLSPYLDASAAAERVRASGSPADVTFTVHDGKLTHVNASFEEYTLDAELYGGDGNTLTVNVDPGFALQLTLGEDIRLEINSSAITTLDWASDGTFDFVTYRNDITDLALEGTLTAGEGALSFDGIWYSGERGDRNPLTLDIASGGEVTGPSETRNIGELTSKDLYRLIAGLIFSFGR